MGNKPSGPERAGSSIIREGRPPRGQTRPPRPVSEPIGSTVPPINLVPDPYTRPSDLYNTPSDQFSPRPQQGNTGSGPPNQRIPDHNFSLRVRDKDSNAISGRHYIVDKQFVSNPDLPATDSGDGGYYDFSYLPRGFPEAIRPEDLQVYMATVNKVTTLWPEYESISQIKIETLSPVARTTLQMILKRLTEQHESLKELTDRQQYYRQEITDISEEQTSARHAIHKKDLEIRGLKEDVQLLRSELQRLGHDGRLPPRHTIQEDLDESMSDTMPPRSGSQDFRQRATSNSSSLNQDEAQKRLKRRERDGIMKATPLLQAEGSMDEVMRVVRNQSQRVPGESQPRVVRRNDSGNSRGEIVRLQAALDKERRENEILRERSSSSSRKESLASLYPKRAISLMEYKDRYHQLEAQALGKVKKTISHQLRHTNMKRQQQFLCTLIQRSYDISFITVRKLKDIIKSLITNPVNINLAQAIGDMSNQRHGSLDNQIKALENFKPGQGINQNISKLVKKTSAGEELPEALINQIDDFLESMSDVTDIIDLVQNVVDSLRQDYGDCTTASLLNQADFSQFMHDCCRLSWQMCIPEKQLYVCSNDKWRYEERYHVTDDNNATTNARIDYYMWPILFSRLSGGEVLYRGRVVIRY